MESGLIGRIVERMAEAGDDAALAAGAAFGAVCPMAGLLIMAQSSAPVGCAIIAGGLAGQAWARAKGAPKRGKAGRDPRKPIEDALHSFAEGAALGTMAGCALGAILWLAL